MTKVYTLKELVSTAPSKVDMLVEDLLPRTGIAGVVGESDVGKSTFLMQLGMCIASKHLTFIGRELNAKHNKVLYISTEDDVFNLQPRLKMMCEGLDIDHEDEPGINLLIANEHEKLPYLINHEFQSNNYDLVIIDSFSDLLVRDGNSATEVRQLLKPYSKIASDKKCLILILHHVRKSSSGSMPDKNDTLGSSAFEAKMRCIIMLKKSKEPDEVIMRIAKGNYLPDELKRLDYLLNFKNLIFSEKSEGGILLPSSLDKDKEAEVIIELVIDELGPDADSKDLFELAQKLKYPYKKSKFYLDVKPYKEQSQELTE